MNNYIYDFQFSIKGAIGVYRYYCTKHFLFGNKIKFRLNPQGVKIISVSYHWNDSKECVHPKIFFNHYCFKVRVPKTLGNSPVLKLNIRVQYFDETIDNAEFSFNINNIC